MTNEDKVFIDTDARLVDLLESIQGPLKVSLLNLEIHFLIHSSMLTLLLW